MRQAKNEASTDSRYLSSSQFRAPLLIDGKAPAIIDAASFLHCGPMSAQPVTKAATATQADIEAAAFYAAKAFPNWSTSAPSLREAILKRAAEKLVDATPQLVNVMMAETGATRQWCEFNIALAARVLNEASGLASAVDLSQPPTLSGDGKSFMFRQAAGVCLAMAAWNAPIMLGDIMQQAGLPDGVLNILSNAPGEAARIVESLIAHPVVRRINFTGSTRVGRIIVQVAARHLKRCLLELGGKSPLIVLSDANLEEAAKAASFGAFFNQGQICMSTERIIVEDAVADQFTELLVSRARNLKANDPALNETPLGALISAEAGSRLMGLVEDARSRGATVCTGGTAYGALMDATVIDHVTSSMRLYREESFGPLVSIIRVADEEEAVSVANDCEYGLSGAIFSQDLSRAMKIAMRVETGILHINSSTVADNPAMPFGGLRGSGYGRIGGTSALDEFTELRWITATSSPADYPF